MSTRKDDDDPRDDMIATAAVVTVYFIFMLLVGFSPALLTRPILQGNPLSIGLVLGVVVTLFLVAASRIYIGRRNRQNPPA